MTTSTILWKKQQHSKPAWHRWAVHLLQVLQVLLFQDPAYKWQILMLIIINLVWYPWSIEWLWTVILINNGNLSHLRSNLHNVLLQLVNLLPQDFHQTIMMFLFLTHFISTQISNANSNKKIKISFSFHLADLEFVSGKHLSFLHYRF